MQVFVVEEDELGEEDGLFVVLLALTARMHLEEELAGQLGHARLPKAEGHRDERIVSAAGGNRIELVFPALEALLEVVDDVLHGLLVGALVGETEGTVALREEHIAALGIRVEQLVDAGDSEAAVLLACRGENDITDNVKGDVERFGLVVPEVAHFKPAAQHGGDVKEAAIHRVTPRGHVVDVDIAVALGLKLLDIEEEFLIQLLVELVEDQAAAGGHQRAVGVGILLVADIHDRLGLLVDGVKHLHEIRLVVAVIPVGLGDGGADGVERSLDDIVHLVDADALYAQGLAFIRHKAADKVLLLVGKGIQHALGALVDR